MSHSKANACLGGVLIALMVAYPLFPARSQVESTFSSRAQGLKGTLPTIKVWSGSGVNLSFIPTGETITKVWIDDPSKVTLDFDRPLCGGGQGRCQPGAGPKIIHLRRVYGIKFPNLPQAKTTLLSVVTQNRTGQEKLNLFRVAIASGTPQYSAFLVYPDSQGKPTLQVGDRIVPLTTITSGMRIAESRRILMPNLKVKVLNFMALANNGIPVTQAAQQAGVSMAVITKLAEMGQSNNRLPSDFSPSNVF